jgi:predicted DNA-binding transcriptional regulator AlpA
MKYLNFQEALMHLQGRGIPMSISSLYRLTASRGIPCEKFGRAYMFDPKELDQWIKERLKQIHV